MATTTVSDKGTVIIPPNLRDRYGLRSGMRVHIVDYGDILAIVPSVSDPIGLSCGMLKGGESLAGTLLDLRGIGSGRGNGGGRRKGALKRVKEHQGSVLDGKGEE